MPPVKRIASSAPAPRRKSVLLAMGFYVHEINMGVAKFAREANWILDDTPSRNGMVPPGWKGDGIVTLVPSFPVPTWKQTTLIDFVSGVKVPVVDLSDQFPHLPFPRVLPDNEAIGRVAAEHLLGRGFRHLAFYTQDLDAPVVQGRLSGFRDAVVKAGRTFHLIDYTPHIAADASHRRLLPWLGREVSALPKPLGAFAQYDGEANDVVRACQLAGLRIPGDVAVVGADNDPIYAELGPVPLSSVVTNREMIGYKGAELLDQLMKGGKAPRAPLRIMPGSVVVRQSSDIMAITETHVAKAMDFIARNYRSAITVEDVVTASGASRRSLYGKFAEHVGHSIQREIVRQRMQRAMALLGEGNDKLQVIAEQCGLEDAGQLSKVFKHHFGLSVSRFREKSSRPS